MKRGLLAVMDREPSNQNCPAPIYSYICRVCLKPCKDQRAWENHEGDAHGNRMRCGRCKFSCPERRPGEMLKHLQKRHQIEAGPHPHKRRRLTHNNIGSEHYTVVVGDLERVKDREMGNKMDYAPPTIRIPPSPKIIQNYRLTASQQGMFPSRH